MKKVKNQILINVLLITFSCSVIYIVKSFTLGRVASFHDCLGSDIIFTMITSLITTFSWRLVEELGKCVPYNFFVGLAICIYCILYGIAIMGNINSVMDNFIIIGMIVFLLIYFVENCIIIYCLKNKLDVGEYYGYKNRRDGDELI